VGDVGVDFGVGRDFEIAVDPEDLANRNFHVGQVGRFGRGGRGGGHQSSMISGAPEARRTQACYGLGCTTKPSRQTRQEEARSSIKVSMQYHQDRLAKRVWKACSANRDDHFHRFATKWPLVIVWRGSSFMRWDDCQPKYVLSTVWRIVVR